MKTALDRVGASALSPRSWPIATRRLFALTFPVSLPLWLSFLVLLQAVFFVRALLRPLRTFWSAPPKRKHRNYGYGYGHGRHGKSPSSNVTALSDHKAA